MVGPRPDARGAMNGNAANADRSPDVTRRARLTCVPHDSKSHDTADLETAPAVVAGAIVFGLVHFDWGLMRVVRTGSMGVALGVSYVHVLAARVHEAGGAVVLA
jgi:hypothetical protein